jgi:hypothetical protein
MKMEVVGSSEMLVTTYRTNIILFHEKGTGTWKKKT